MKSSKEILGLVFLLFLGLAPRLEFIHIFPTIPVSDFNSIVSFGEFLHDRPLTENVWYWEFFHPGLPLLLSALFRIFPGDPASVARISTAVVCGLLPLIPFLIWRGVLPFPLRILTGAALALWPGQVMFSGVVAQDNWVVPPTIALGALAVKALVTKHGARPIAAGVLLAGGVIMRQEMLLPLFPLFFAAAGLRLRPDWRRIAKAALAAGLPLIALAAYRGVTTGRYTLSTEHSGLAVLGAYVPGASVNGWIDPYPFVASVRPDLLRNRKALLTEASTLAFQEFLRRPRFQMARMLQATVTYIVAGEAQSLYWSVRSAEALPPPLVARGMAFSLPMMPLLRYEMAGIQGLFFAALIVAAWRRSKAILALASAVLLKFLIHAVVAAQGRYFFPATALEILAVAVAAWEIWAAPPAGKRKMLAIVLSAGILCSLGLLVSRLRLEIYVQKQDTDPQRTYRFPVAVADHGAALDCVMNRGLLTALYLPREATQSAAIRTRSIDPAWGDSATAVCDLTGTGKPRPLTLQVLDPYAPGGFPDRMLQRVEIDGAEVYSHDLAKDPGSGWANIPLGNVGEGTKHKVLIEVKAVQPERGPAWGDAAVTTFQLSRD